MLLWKLDVGSDTLRCLATGRGHTAAIGGLVFSRLRSSFLVTGSNDLTLKLWRLPANLGAASEEDKVKVVTLEARLTERGHDKDVNAVAVSPNDRMLASGSQDKTVKVGSQLRYDW